MLQYADPPDALNDGLLRDPRVETITVPKEPAEHGGMPDILLQPIEKSIMGASSCCFGPALLYE